MSLQPELTRLTEHVDMAVGLEPEAMAREIQAALRDATAKTGWLPPERRRVNHDNYARHLLYGDPQGQFSILSIVWDHGQQSPIHGHYCWCAVGVYLGTLTETYYREVAAGVPEPVETKQRGAGTLSFEPANNGIHRIANDSGAVAISLHVYGVASNQISTRVNRALTRNA